MSPENCKSFLEEMQGKYEMTKVEYMPPYYAESGLRIEAAKRHREEQGCPYCGSPETNVHEYKRKEIKFGTLNGVAVTIVLPHCRYKCKKCEGTFMEAFEFLPEYRGISTDAENYMISMMGSLSFSEIARQIGVSSQTVVNRAKAYAETEKQVQLNGKYRYLSMDEVFITRDSDGKPVYYWLLNDNSCPWKSNNIRLDLGRSQSDVVKRLRELKHPEKVEAVSIDMWRQYRDAIAEALPNAAIVVDPFHLVQLAQSLLEQVRKGAAVSPELKAEMKKDTKLFSTSLFRLSDDELVRLDSYLKASPELNRAYFIVQSISCFYQLRDYDAALDFIVKWEAEVLASGVKEMVSLLHTVQNWLPYIMNFFIHRITNGRTEGKNHLLRVIDRIGFHYGVDSIQACVFAHDRKQEYLKWQKHLAKRLKRQATVA